MEFCRDFESFSFWFPGAVHALGPFRNISSAKIFSTSSTEMHQTTGP